LKIYSWLLLHFPVSKKGTSQKFTPKKGQALKSSPGQDRLLTSKGKEYFRHLLERFASGFFVQIHAFAILDNHFHILLTGTGDRWQGEQKRGKREDNKIAFLFLFVRLFASLS
jgi:hypothetical protein